MKLNDILTIAAGLYSFYWATRRLRDGFQILRDQKYSYHTKDILPSKRKLVEWNGVHTRPFAIAVVLSGIVALIILILLLLNGVWDGFALLIFPLAGASFFEVTGYHLSERHFRNK